MDIMICLRRREDVVRFVALAEKLDADINLVKGSIIVDAKSFLGVMGLGLAQKLGLQVVGGDSERNMVLSQLKDFVINPA